MNSEEFIKDFTEWIRTHTSIEALYIVPDHGKMALLCMTSNRSLFLQNFMIFSDYDNTTYCKLFNFDDVPYLEIEFQSGHEALIEFISEDYVLTDQMTEVFDRR